MASGTASPERTLSFLSQKYSYAYSSLASNGVLNITATNLKYTVPDGYTPFSFTQYATGNANVAVARIYPRSTGTVVTLRNRGSSAVSATFSITITFVPIDLVEDVSGKYSAELDSFVYTPGGMFVDPVTRKRIDEIYFSPDESVCFTYLKSRINTSTGKYTTLSSYRIEKINEESVDVYYPNATDYSGDRFYKTITMPSDNIKIHVTYSNGHLLLITVNNGGYTTSPSMPYPTMEEGTTVHIEFSTQLSYSSTSIESNVPLEKIADNQYDLVMPNEDVFITYSFIR